MNWVFKEAGKEVGVEKEALRGKKLLIPVDDFIKSIDDKIAERTIDDISTLDDKDIKALSEIKDLLGKGITKELKDETGQVIGEKTVMDASKLNIIKKRMQNLAKYDPQTVSKIGSEGQGILKAVSSQISDSVNKAVPELGRLI